MMFITAEMGMKFFKQTKIRKYSSRADSRLKSAFSSARNRYSVSRNDRDLVRARHDLHLRAVNHQSRLIWGKAVSRQLARHLCAPKSLNQNQPVFFVTLCDVSCATAVENTEPDIRKYIARLRVGLRGFSYFAVLEPAYYTNLQQGSRIKNKKCVIWHAHAVVWGISEIELDQHVADLNASERYYAVAENLPGVDCRLIKRGDLAQMVGYCLKPPANSYRLSRIDTEWQNIPIYQFIQGKNPLRPGERVRLFHAIKNLCLPDLAFAGGEGAALLAAAKTDAYEASGLSSLLATERRERRRKPTPGNLERHHQKRRPIHTCK
jgi:hypothetical protein